MTKYYVVRMANNEHLFVPKSVVAVGWSDIDFSSYDDIDMLCDDVRNHYYLDTSNQKAGRKLGEIRRFKSIQKDDILLVPCYRGFYIAKSTGAFIYDRNSHSEDRANQLKVEYIADDNGNPMIFNRYDKSTALSSKLGIPGFTILEIWEKEIISEVDELVAKKKDSSYLSKIITEENNKLLMFKNSIKEVLPDYKKIGLEAGGIGFEKLLKSLLAADGFSAKILSKQIGGSGTADADILATKCSKLGDEFSSVLYIQAKHYIGESDNGIDQIVSFKEKINKDNINGQAKVQTEDGEISVNVNDIKYVLVSTGLFTEYVIDKAEQENITLIDINRLSEMLYEMMDDIPEILHSLGYVKTYQHINS